MVNKFTQKRLASCMIIAMQQIGISAIQDHINVFRRAVLTAIAVPGYATKTQKSVWIQVLRIKQNSLQKGKGPHLFGRQALSRWVFL